MSVNNSIEAEKILLMKIIGKLKTKLVIGTRKKNVDKPSGKSICLASFEFYLLFSENSIELTAIISIAKLSHNKSQKNIKCLFAIDFLLILRNKIQTSLSIHIVIIEFLLFLMKTTN